MDSTPSIETSKIYDVIVVGTGSAGLPAGMYAARYKLDTLVIGGIPGGALAQSHQVENYPGTLSASGKEIMNHFAEHTKVSWADILIDEVTKIEKEGDIFSIHTSSGWVKLTQSVILATGNKYKKLDVPGEDRLIGMGVSYCATCDGNFFKNQVIAMVGGWDSAVTEALYLSHIAREVHLLVRGDSMKAEQIWQEKLKETKNIIVHYSTSVASIEGDFNVDHLVLQDGNTLKVDGIFVAIGSTPDVSLVRDLWVNLDAEWYIMVNAAQATNIEGLYAAWDVTTNSNKFQQTIMSAAEWCLAAHSAHEYILRK